MDFISTHWSLEASCQYKENLCDKCDINLLLTEHEGRIGEHSPEVVAVPIECSNVSAETIEGQYSSVRLEQTKKYTAYDRLLHMETVRCKWKILIKKGPDLPQDYLTK